MKNTPPKKKPAAGRQSKSRPDVKATAKPKTQRVEQKKTPAQTLEDSEIRYRRLFEAAQDGILILDAQTGAIDDVNPYLINMLGYSRAEFVKKKLWEVGAFKDVDASKIAFNALQEKGYLRYENLPLRAKDGQLIQVEFVSNVYLAGGKIVIQCNIRNITGHKQAEEKLQTSEKLYHNLFENMLNGFAYCQMFFEGGRPLDFIYLDVNLAFETLTGLTNVVGKKVSEVIPGIRESDPGLFEIYGRVALTGKPERFETYVAALKMWFLISVYSPQKEYFVAVFDVITERKRAEEALRLENERLLRFIDSNIVGIVIADTGGKVLQANDYYLNILGVTRQDLLAGKVEWIKFTPTEWLPADNKAIAELRQRGICEPYEKEYERADGRRVPVYLADAMLPGPGEQIACFILDITERKRAEEEIRNLAKFPDENPFPVLRLNEKGVILYANPASKEVLKDWKTDIGGEAPSFWRKKVADVLANRSNQIVDIPIGAQIISFAIVPVIEANHVNLYGRDITERKRAEERIAYQAQLLANVNDAIVGSDEQYRITAWNASAESMYGWKAEEVLGRNGTELLQTKWPDEDANVMRRKIAETGRWRGEASQRRKDGTWIPVELSTIVLYDENGRITGFLSVNRDITERKQAEEKMRESQDRYSRLFENMHETIVIQKVVEDEAGKPADLMFLDLNPAAERVFGKKRSEIVGRTRSQVSGQPDPEGVSIASRVAATGEPYHWVRSSPGFGGWFDSTTYSLGQGIVASLALDITDKKLAEEELRKAHNDLELQVQQRTAALSQSNMLLQTLLDNMPDQIYFKDLGSRFIKNSRAQANAMGLSDPSQVVGKTDFDFFPHARRSYDEEQEIIRSGKPQVDFEEWVVWPDGHETWVSTTKVPLRDQQGEIIGTFGISRDITDRKRNEEALGKARDELEAFSYSVSHDLRAPLRGIDGWSLALLEDYGGQLDKQGQEYIQRVRFETQHMGELIDDLLQLSRITRAEMHSERVDLSAVARSIAARLQEGEPRRRVEFVIQDGLSAIGDAHLIEVVLTNLLGNAFKFTGKVPVAHIEFGLMNMDGQRVFFVHDNGAGFDMAYAKKLFGAFQRMHKDSEFPGTGIGLATVQRIINRHGGRVWAESAVNQGATFFFTL